MRYSQGSALPTLRVTVRCGGQFCFGWCRHDGSTTRITFRLNGRLLPSHPSWSERGGAAPGLVKGFIGVNSRYLAYYSLVTVLKGPEVSGRDIRSCCLHCVSVKSEQGGAFVFQARGGQRPLLTLNPISLGINSFIPAAFLSEVPKLSGLAR